MQSTREHVSPTIIPIGGCTVAIRDRIAKRHNCRGTRESGDVEPGKLVPMIEFLCLGEIKGRDEIAMQQV